MDRTSVEKRTGSIYGNLFSSYSKELFDQSVELFYKRHKEWELDLGFNAGEWFKGKTCLDAGCGGGRFVVAVSTLGAAKVEGIDVSQNAVSAASERILAKGLTNAHVQVASVLEVPFESKTFDYVLSSGVIHHTPDPYKAFTELDRVLKPGGKMFLSVYGKGGLKWLLNDIFRYTVCKVIPFPVMEKLFALVGVPANKRYNILDNLYVDYCSRYSENEIREWFKKHGYWNLRRVKFERYDYSTIMSRVIHGEGWIQIYADKLADT